MAVPGIPEVAMGQGQIDSLKRVFFLSTNDFSKGIALISYYLEGAEYREALRVIDALLQLSEPPTYVYYWRAEILYQLEDYLGSWSAFDAYWKQIK
jgi:hypothetical protein